MPSYLDCNATTPVEPAVQTVVMRFLAEEFGNAGSRTHNFGTVAKKAVQKARAQVGAVVAAKPDEVVFTSGATESNNLALLGLAAEGERSGKRHIVSTSIEHKAVLEPLEELQRRGFEVTLVDPEPGGFVDAERLLGAVRADTLLVSMMHVNNETGVIQPIEEVAAGLGEHDAFFHVDAAQGFGKLIDTLRTKRIDFMSVSAHKVYGPKGVGALVARRRGYARPPLSPTHFGGGQERGLRPGTLPVPLVAGFGLAAELAEKDHAKRAEKWKAFRGRLFDAVREFDPAFNGEVDRTLPSTLNFSLPGLDSEAAIVALKDVVAVSNGSACTSSSYEPSHVLTAMGLPEERVAGALRFSWCHMTDDPDWDAFRAALRSVIVQAN